MKNTCVPLTSANLFCHKTEITSKYFDAPINTIQLLRKGIKHY